MIPSVNPQFHYNNSWGILYIACLAMIEWFDGGAYSHNTFASFREYNGVVIGSKCVCAICVFVARSVFLDNCRALVAAPETLAEGRP